MMYGFYVVLCTIYTIQRNTNKVLLPWKALLPTARCDIVRQPYVYYQPAVSDYFKLASVCANDHQ